jgi:hypothetical protein
VAPQAKITGALILEGNTSAVVAVAVRLDDQPVLAPGKVNEDAVNPYVHLRDRQPVSPAELEKEELELTARRVILAIAINLKPKDRGLSSSATHLDGRRDLAEVKDGASGSGDGDSSMP